ncbi:MAG: hypothetical protein IIX84_03245 [Oscillospiraceae bacterium]|nr:hypothetical protein [Oscillospiraceae bacterium]
MKRFRLIWIVAVMGILFSSCGGRHTDGGELRVGVSSEISGGLGYGQWKESEADGIIRELTVGGSPVVCSETGEYAVDKRYAEKIDSEFLPSGDKKYTVELRKNIRWSDGGKVTAENYVASVLLFSCKTAKTAGSLGDPGSYYVGAEEYAETGIFAGVRLIDEFTFSVTVSAEHVPYYWEYSYLSIYPIDTELWLPEGVSVKDGEGGCSFTLPKLITAEHISAVRFQSPSPRCLGPYIFKGVEDGVGVLEKNPNYIAADKRSDPKIGKILFVQTEKSVSAVESGKADIVLGVEASLSALERLEKSGNFAVSGYGASYITDFVFQCDLGPTGFTEVRQAVSFLCNRQKFASVISGDGATVPEFVFSEALENMLSPGFKPNYWQKNSDKAKALLSEGGWVLNAAGQSYSSGLRYKLVSAKEAEDCIDAVVLEDGRILMPLRLRFACSENSPCVAFLEDLALSAEMVGMEVVWTELEKDVLSDRLTRNASDGIAYAVPLYNGYLIEIPVDTRGDLSVRWTSDWRAVSEGKNICYFEDEELCDLALKLSYISENSEEFSQFLTEHTSRWCAAVPELPLSRGRVYDVFSAKLSGYEADSGKSFSRAVLEAWIEE